MRTFKCVLQAVVIVLLLLINACSDDKVVTEKVLKVGLSPDFPPFETTIAGQVVGFDIDLINAIAGHLGRSVQITAMPFYSLLGALESHQIDVVISGLSATLERLEVVDFSKSYYNPGMAVVFRSKAEQKQLGDNVKVGAQTGSVMELWARTNIASNNYSKTRLVVVDSNPQLIEHLKNGSLDLVVLETLQAVNFCKMVNDDDNESALGFSEVGPTDYGYAIALRKNDPLLNDINAALEKVINSPELQKMREKWGVH